MKIKWVYLLGALAALLLAAGAYFALKTGSSPAPAGEAKSPTPDAASQLPDAHTRIVAVDCAEPAKVWKINLVKKLNLYTRQLTRQRGDVPGVRQEINREWKVYRDKIRESAETSVVCEKISEELNQWYATKEKEG